MISKETLDFISINYNNFNESRVFSNHLFQIKAFLLLIVILNLPKIKKLLR